MNEPWRRVRQQIPRRARAAEPGSRESPYSAAPAELNNLAGRAEIRATQEGLARRLLGHLRECGGAPAASKLEIIAHAQDSGLLLFLDATSPLRADVVCGRSAPVQGWVSSRYGVKQPAQVLCATVECSLSLLAATIIAPLQMNGESLAIPAVRRATVAGCALSYSITHGQHTDFLIVPGTGADTEIEGLKLQGELFWLRASGGAPRQLLGVTVRRIVQQETVPFDEPQPAAHLLALFFEDRIVIQDGTTKDKVYVRDLRDCKVPCG